MKHCIQSRPLPRARLLALNRIFFLAAIILASVSFATSRADSLPEWVSHNMVLQQDTEIILKGTAKLEKREKQVILLCPECPELERRKRRGDLNDDGSWEIKLPKIASGGPYNFSFVASGTQRELFRVTNVTVGEVWVLACPNAASVPFREPQSLAQTLIPPGKFRFAKVEPDIFDPNTTRFSVHWEVAQTEQILTAEHYFSNQGAYLAQSLLQSNATKFVGVIQIRTNCIGLQRLHKDIIPQGTRLIISKPIGNLEVTDAYYDLDATRHQFKVKVADLKRAGMVVTNEGPPDLYKINFISTADKELLPFAISGVLW